MKPPRRPFPGRVAAASVIAVLLFSVAGPAGFAANKPDKPREKETEAASLRASLESLRDSLQNEIAGRWRTKQKYVEERESDKEELSRLKETQEKAYAELSRVREESLSKENISRDGASALAARNEEHRQSVFVMEDVFSKEAEAVIEAFPLDIEQRRNDLESLRRSFQKNQDIALSLDRFLRYKMSYLETASRLSLLKRTVLADDGKPRLLSVARFGNAFAYAMSETGDFFFLRQSGRLGTDRFRIDKIESAALRESLADHFPQWMKAGVISGKIPTDVLQNEQTKLLASGKKATGYQKFLASIKAGGAVMIPLLLLPLWAFVLIVIKLVQLTGKRTVFARQCRSVLRFLDNNDRPGALSYAKSCRGLAARMFETCLAGAQNDRGTTEKMLRELLIGELPRMSSHLNTLAVIAGAAPLLGLLGTISGMINLFGAVTHYGTGDPKFLAGGISEALITAKTGLAVAIPTLFIHDYLRNKKDRLQSDIEQYAMRILNRLWPRG
jgi:biopolymer transport protein ExbB/TolQ